MNEHVLITICGRAGSKGFRNKNLKIFDGLPLSHYSLAAADLFKQQRPDLDVDVCLNTDSELLIDVVTSKYPEVEVIRRPEELCGDVVPKMRVYQHSLHVMEERTAKQYDTLIDLDITSPLRRVSDVAGALAVKCARPELDLVFSVCPARRTPYFNMAKLDENGYARRVIDHHFTARQQTPPVYDLNASIYVFGRKFLCESETGFLWDGKCGIYEMFDTGIVDIDSEEDYLLMEAIARHLYASDPAFGDVRRAIRT